MNVRGKPNSLMINLQSAKCMAADTSASGGVMASYATNNAESRDNGVFGQNMVNCMIG